MTNPPTIKAMVQAVPRSLGSYGPVLEEIERALESPQCNLSTIGDAIQKDPDLTARLLRLANSPFFGFANRLSTVSEAVSLLGIQQIQDMIIASSVLEQFKGVPDKFVNKHSFWRHSLAVGITARLLAMERRLPKPDKFFVAGLLHDVGRLVLLSQAAEWAQAVFELYQRERILLRDAEKKILGYDHQQIAAELLQSWSYPPVLVQAVAFHHLPSQSGAKLETAVVHIADHLVNAMGIGSSGEQFIPPLDDKAWTALGLSSETLAKVIEAVDEQILAVEEAFLEKSKRRTAMSETFDSVYPDFLRTGLEKLSQLGAQRELPALFAALEHFRHDLHEQDSAKGVLRVSQDYLSGLNLFRKTAFWTVNTEDFNFELALAGNEADGVILQSIVDGQIKAGRFAYALRQGTPVFFLLGNESDPERGVLHSLAISSQVMGMFCGLLRREVAPAQEVAFSLLSMLLGVSADALATLRRTRQLTGQIEALQSLLPVCAWCKKVRNDSGYWYQIEKYITANSKTQITHGICPECENKMLDTDK